MRREKKSRKGGGLEEAAGPELEDPCVLQEELPLLGEEEGEAGEVDALLVRLHLREVGVDGGIQHHSGVDLPLDVAAHVSPPLGFRFGRVLVGPGEAEGLDLQVEAGAGQVGQALDPTRAAHPVEAPVGARPAGPERLLVLAALHPIDVEAPRAPVPRVAQGTERDGKLRRPAPLDPLGRHLPDRPPVGVEGLALVGDERVVLRPVRVGPEHEGVAAVEEGVEQQEDDVVARRASVPPPGLDEAVALQDPADHPVRLGIPGEDADVEVLAVEEQAYFRVVGGGGAFLRLALLEAGGRGGLGPGRFVEAAIQDDRREAWQAGRNRNGRPLGEPHGLDHEAVRRGRARLEGHEKGEEREHGREDGSRTRSAPQGGRSTG